METLVDHEQAFFAPVKTNAIEEVLSFHNATKKALEEVHGIVVGHRYNRVIDYFIDGNVELGRRMYHSTRAEKLFALEPAIAALNSESWRRALALTDVYDCMPKQRRDDWNAMLQEHKTPAFERETVMATLEDLLLARNGFLAEKVDGIFRGLSNEHLTNRPQGFAKRFIISGVLSYGSVNYHQIDYIHDLRCVIAKFMGREDPHRTDTSRMVDRLQEQWGEWRILDGGALKIRLYKKGTAHMEVHPAMAVRLNQILAFLHPSAIPSEFRTRKAKFREQESPIQSPLPFKVLGVLGELRFCSGNRSARFPFEQDKYLISEAGRVLESIGAVVTENGIEFGFNAKSVIMEIVDSGCVPEKKSHQFYPTPMGLAEAVVAHADIKLGMSVLEPSAGIGSLAVPAREFGGLVTCVEISAVHCSVLRARGFDTCDADFLSWSLDAMASQRQFDRIVMNPPFTNRQADEHFNAAMSLLTTGGRLVAVLPSGIRRRMPDQIKGFDIRWFDPAPNLFPDASVSVVLCVVEKKMADFSSSLLEHRDIR